jgi:hypothetical protein
MSQYFRIFSRSDVPPAPVALAEELHRLHADATAHFRGDDLGWFEARFVLDPDTPPVQVERFLTKDDEIRGELNTWAAWLESAGDTPIHHRLMQHVSTSVQLFTVRQSIEETDDLATEPSAEATCLALCQFLARATEGIYQVDHQGFFAAAGTLLVAE